MTERIFKEISEIICTERFLKGDLVAQPARAIVEASELSQWFFEEGLYLEEGQKHRIEYLKSLPERRTKLYSLITSLESLEANFEAGLYDESLDNLRRFLVESGVAEELWEQEFCSGFGG
jgi:hypothetical protein